MVKLKASRSLVRLRSLVNFQHQETLKLISSPFPTLTQIGKS